MRDITLSVCIFYHFANKQEKPCITKITRTSNTTPNDHHLASWFSSSVMDLSVANTGSNTYRTCQLKILLHRTFDLSEPIATVKKYEIRHNTASLTQIVNYLQEADDHFIPSLSDKVDIEVYARKICDHAETIEAWQENTLIGLLAVYLNNVKYSSAYITSVSILKSFHGAGIAKELMDHCINLAKRLNFDEVSLEVDRENGRAISFYHKIGFSERHRNDQSIFMSHNLVRG